MKSLSITFKKSDAHNLFHKKLHSEVSFINGSNSPGHSTHTQGTIVFSQEFKCGKVVLVCVGKQDTFSVEGMIVPLWLSQCGQSGVLIQYPYHAEQNVDPDLTIALDTYKLQTQKSELDEREFQSLYPLMTA